MSDEYKDGVEFGAEGHEQQEPLSKQEIEILKSMQQQLTQAETSFNLWLRDVGNRKPSQKVTFAATIQGDTLKEMMFMYKHAVEGLHLLTKAELASNIIMLGIKALQRKLMEESMGRMMKAVKLLHMPPEMAQQIITKEIRADIASYVKKSNEDMAGTIRDMSAPEIKAEEPKLAKPVLDTPSAVKPATESPEPVSDGNRACFYCGKPCPPEDCHPFQGKWGHREHIMDFIAEKKRDQWEDERREERRRDALDIAEEQKKGNDEDGVNE